MLYNVDRTDSEVFNHNREGFNIYKILVVDDEVRIRSIIKKYAEFEGHTVAEVGDGMQGVEFCRKGSYDIIIMDIMMPELDGFSACREIRKNYKHSYNNALSKGRAKCVLV